MKKIDQVSLKEKIVDTISENNYNLLVYYLRRRKHFVSFPPFEEHFDSMVQLQDLDIIDFSISKSPEGGYLFQGSTFLTCNLGSPLLNEEIRAISFYADLYGYFDDEGQLMRSPYPHSFFILPPKIGEVGYRNIRMYYSNEMNHFVPKVMCCYENNFTSYFRTKEFTIDGTVFGKVVTTSGVCQIVKNQIDMSSPVVQWMRTNRDFIEANWMRCIKSMRPEFIESPHPNL